jgi:predicted small secreted protein
MKKYIQVILLSFVFFNLSGCVISEVDNIQPQVKVVSLINNYESLYESAVIWDESAYLENVTIPIELDENSYILLSAHFQSPYKVSESIAVELLSDGNININYIEHTIDVVQTEAIEFSEVSIDSSQVLSIIMKNDQKMNLNASAIISLKLENYYFEGKKHIVWRLCTDMLSHDARIYFVDAKTGEMLNLSE